MSWITTCGKPDADLEAIVSSRVKAKIAQGLFAERDVAYIASLHRPLSDKKLVLTSERLELIRKLCQLWEFDVVPPKVSSHRKIIGPCIVALKRCLFPIVRVLLKDSIKRQREFNATVIKLLTNLSGGL
jgi:hypothetical protein